MEEAAHMNRQVIGVDDRILRHVAIYSNSCCHADLRPKNENTSPGPQDFASGGDEFRAFPTATNDTSPITPDAWENSAATTPAD
jgi:hypothetical protein